MVERQVTDNNIAYICFTGVLLGESSTNVIGWFSSAYVDELDEETARVRTTIAKRILLTFN
jgi:hypothetical protein